MNDDVRDGSGAAAPPAETVADDDFDGDDGDDDYTADSIEQYSFPALRPFCTFSLRCSPFMTSILQNLKKVVPDYLSVASNSVDGT